MASTTPFGFVSSGGIGERGPRGFPGEDGRGILSVTLIDNNDGTSSVQFTYTDGSQSPVLASSLLSDNLLCSSVDASSFVKTSTLKVGGTTYALPEDGIDGQVLRTNGSGGLSWTANDLQTAYDNGQTINVSADIPLVISGTSLAEQSFDYITVGDYFGNLKFQANSVSFKGPDDVTYFTIDNGPILTPGIPTNTVLPIRQLDDHVIWEADLTNSIPSTFVKYLRQ